MLIWVYDSRDWLSIREPVAPARHSPRPAQRHNSDDMTLKVRCTYQEFLFRRLWHCIATRITYLLHPKLFSPHVGYERKLIRLIRKRKKKYQLNNKLRWIIIRMVVDIERIERAVWIYCGLGSATQLAKKKPPCLLLLTPWWEAEPKLQTNIFYWSYFLMGKKCFLLSLSASAIT